MRYFFTLLCVILSWQLQAQKLLILGDSLSAGYGMQQQQGWVHLLQQQSAAKKLPWRLVNASISGETTAGGLARLPELLQQHQPDTVLIELGGNDGLRGFPIPTIEKNLLQIIELVKAQRARPVLMQIRIPPNYGPRYNQMFVALYPRLAKQQQLTLWPFFMDQIAIEPNLMQADGIHPNVKAQAKISNMMLPLLEDLVEN
jgi:acyl-CoA thioesterase-1